MKKACLSFLTAGILATSVSIAPSLAASLSTSTAGVKSDSRLSSAKKSCETGISRIKLGSFEFAIPSGPVEGTTESVNGATVTTIANTRDAGTKYMAVYFDDYRPVAGTDDPDTVREQVLSKNIEVWKTVGLLPGTQSLGELDETNSFKVDFHEPGSAKASIRVFGKILISTHEVIVVTLISNNGFADCQADTFDIRLKTQTGPVKRP